MVTMIKKSKWMAVGLSICIAVAGVCTGCGNSKIGTKKVKLAAGTPDKDSIVMSVGSDGVEYSEMMNYAYLLKRQYEGNFGSELWNYSLGGNKTVGAQAKQEIVNMVTQLKVIAQAADRNEVSLTNDEKDEAMQKAEKIMDLVNWMKKTCLPIKCFMWLLTRQTPMCQMRKQGRLQSSILRS